jgi:O-antigen ligase
MKGLIFTYLLTYGGAIVSLFRPWYGFLIYVSFGILKPESVWSWSVESGNYSRIVASGFLLGWALNGFGTWRFGKGSLVIVSMILYWLWFVISGATSTYPEIGLARVENLAKVFLPIVAAATLVESVAQIRQLVWTIVVSMSFLAYEFNLSYYAGRIIPWEWGHGGLDNNGIAINMVTGIGLAFYLGLHSERWWQKLIALVGAALMAHVVLFSNSRGGMLSLLVTMATCFVLTPKRPRDFLIFLVGIALVFRLAGEQVQKRFFTSFAEKGAVEGADEGGRRLEHWAGCWDSFQKHLMGIGPDHWPITGGPAYGLPTGQAAHSTWLQMAAELGIPGMILLAGIYGTCLVRLWPMTRERRPVYDPWLRYLARMVISGLIGFLASASFVTVDGIELPYYIALVGAATLSLASQPVLALYPTTNYWPAVTANRPSFLGRPVIRR